MGIFLAVIFFQSSTHPTRQNCNVLEFTKNIYKKTQEHIFRSVEVTQSFKY